MHIPGHHHLFRVQALQPIFPITLQQLPYLPCPPQHLVRRRLLVLTMLGTDGITRRIPQLVMLQFQLARIQTHGAGWAYPYQLNLVAPDFKNVNQFLNLPLLLLQFYRIYFIGSPI
jgi:hypothetical protein